MRVPGQGEPDEYGVELLTRTTPKITKFAPPPEEGPDSGVALLTHVSPTKSFLDKYSK